MQVIEGACVAPLHSEGVAVRQASGPGRAASRSPRLGERCHGSRTPLSMRLEVKYP